MHKLVGALLVSLAAAGCTVPVARGLAEGDANDIISALERHGVWATKTADTHAEGRWSIVVAGAEASAAAVVLAQEGLPPRDNPGVLTALKSDTLVPSRASEHARLMAGTAGDLERSLRTIPGVLSVRVHLAAPGPAATQLADGPPKPTASVLLRYRSATLALPEARISELVAGAVPGLESGQVSVVATRVPPPKEDPDRGLTRFGPIVVAKGSAAVLRAVVAGMTVLNLALIALLVGVWTRYRRLRLAGDERDTPRPLPEALPR